MTAEKEVGAMMKATGWSRWKLAQQSGVLTSTVSRILDDGMDPRHSTMEKLRKAVAKHMAKK